MRNRWGTATMYFDTCMFCFGSPTDIGVSAAQIEDSIQLPNNVGDVDILYTSSHDDKQWSKSAREPRESCTVHFRCTLLPTNYIMKAHVFCWRLIFKLPGVQSSCRTFHVTQGRFPKWQLRRILVMCIAFYVGAIMRRTKAYIPQLHDGLDITARVCWQQDRVFGNQRQDGREEIHHSVAHHPDHHQQRQCAHGSAWFPSHSVFRLVQPHITSDKRASTQLSSVFKGVTVLKERMGQCIVQTVRIAVNEGNREVLPGRSALFMHSPERDRNIRYLHEGFLFLSFLTLVTSPVATNPFHSPIYHFSHERNRQSQLSPFAAIAMGPKNCPRRRHRDGHDIVLSPCRGSKPHWRVHSIRLHNGLRGCAITPTRLTQQFSG